MKKSVKIKKRLEKILQNKTKIPIGIIKAQIRLSNNEFNSFKLNKFGILAAILLTTAIMMLLNEFLIISLVLFALALSILVVFFQRQDKILSQLEEKILTTCEQNI